MCIQAINSVNCTEVAVRRLLRIMTYGKKLIWAKTEREQLNMLFQPLKVYVFIPLGQ